MAAGRREQRDEEIVKRISHQDLVEQTKYVFLNKLMGTFVVGIGRFHISANKLIFQSTMEKKGKTKRSALKSIMKISICGSLFGYQSYGRF